MIARLPTSKKWTNLPAELCEQIREVFAENFAQLAKGGSLIVEGRIYPEELVLRVGYIENGRLQQANFEVSMDFDSAKQNALEQIHLAIDCAASMMEEYCDGEFDLEPFPREWSSVKVDKKVIFIQVSTTNTSLEAEADRLLGLAEDQLVHEEDDLDFPDDDEPLPATDDDEGSNDESGDDGGSGGAAGDGAGGSSGDRSSGASSKKNYH